MLVTPPVLVGRGSVASYVAWFPGRGMRLVYLFFFLGLNMNKYLLVLGTLRRVPCA